MYKFLPRIRQLLHCKQVVSIPNNYNKVRQYPGALNRPFSIQNHTQLVGRTHVRRSALPRARVLSKRE
jgi:hypothetical protein